MPDPGPVRIFVSHLFERDPDYLRVFEYLESRDRFLYLNVSDPDRSSPGGREGMKEELRSQIKASEVVIVPISLYDQNRDLVGFQMDCAGAFNKPVIGVKSFGGTIVIQKEFLDRTAVVVDWDARTLVDAIRHHARHEDVARWDVVEFKPD